MSATSAIDLLIVYANNDRARDLDERVDALASQIRTWTGNEVDIESLVEDEVAVRVANDHDSDLLVDVSRHGVPVFGRTDWLVQRVIEARRSTRASRAS